LNNTTPMVSHGPDGLWLSTYGPMGNGRITVVTTLTREEAEYLIAQLHQGIADEMRGTFGKPAERGFG
jgi:hypothetical protein